MTSFIDADLTYGCQSGYLWTLTKASTKDFIYIVNGITILKKFGFFFLQYNRILAITF